MSTQSNLVLLEKPEVGACAVIDCKVFHGGTTLTEKTAQGWVLIGLMQEQVLQECTEDMPPPEGSYSNIGLRKQYPVTRTLALLRQSRDATLEAAYQEATRLKEEASKAALTQKQAEDKVEQLQHKVQELEGRVVDLKADAQARRQDLERCQQRKTDMERDLGKVRKVLGERQMREILGEEKKA